mmetsp:Transcript_13764/g.32768  ORF Transcript_13764/g.32768 Transcript_13764/m.32768 type:complete len:192 (+) Transcript_13764:226-801(+)
MGGWVGWVCTSYTLASTGRAASYMYLPARMHSSIHSRMHAMHATDKRASKQSSKPNTSLIKLSSSKETRERETERERGQGRIAAYVCETWSACVGVPSGRTDRRVDGWMDPSGFEGQVQQYDYDEQQDGPASNPLEAAPKQVKIERQTHRTQEVSPFAALCWRDELRVAVGLVATNANLPCVCFRLCHDVH